MGPFRQESQSEHTHKLTLRTAYIATCVTHAYETRHPSPINYTHVPRMAPQVNGEAPSSAFLSHLISYPVISDSISTFKSNPYGAKSLSITTSLSHQALPIRLSLHHQSRLPRRLHPLHHRLQVPRRQETYRCTDR